MPKISNQKIDVIAPNLKRRLSGVTATIVRLVPLQNEKLGVVATGPGLPDDIPHISLWRAAFLGRQKWRVWHARRNTEMLLGLFLRHVLRRRFKLLFTSASQRVHSRYTAWLVTKMDAVIATSKKTAGYLNNPPTVILHGIDTGTFSPPKNQADTRQKLGLPPSAKIIGCYGRIRAQKGTDVFVDAAIELAQKHNDLVAIVMGRATDPYVKFGAELKARVAHANLADRILFLPEVPVHEMASWYQVLDLFIAPQRWEGFGLTPIEAMACGVPTVATRVGAFEELVVDGQTGALIDAGNTDQMVSAADTLLSDDNLRQTQGQQALTHIDAHFKLQREADQIIDVYRQLLSEC